MRLIDFHSHFFSLPFFEALAALAPGPEDSGTKLAGVARRAGFELPPADVGRHLARWTADLDRHGVEHMVTFASVPEEVPAVAEALRLAGGRLSGCALVNPASPGCRERVGSLLAEEGFAGLLLFPAMHHYRVSGPEAAPILELAAEHGAIVFVHCGLLVVRLRDLLGLPRPYDLSFANPLDLIPAANAARGAHFVIPHFGAGFFRETLMAGTQCENVHVDTSSSNRWIETQAGELGLRDVFRRALDVFGPSRILFGTDSNVFPVGWRRERLDEQRAILDELNVSADDRARILGGNAARLLRLA